jgi:hypothetical protein
VIFPKDSFLIDALTWPEVALLVVVVTGVPYGPEGGFGHVDVAISKLNSA